MTLALKPGTVVEPMWSCVQPIAPSTDERKGMPPDIWLPGDRTWSWQQPDLTRLRPTGIRPGKPHLAAPCLSRSGL